MICPHVGRRSWATMRSMVAYTKAAVERAMQVQEVILRAMAKRITWWQAAEIIGISDRSMRRWRERYEQHGYDGSPLWDAERQAGAAGHRRAGSGTLPGALLRPERATFPREAGRGAPDRTELHLGEAGAAGRGAGGSGAQARRASQAPAAPGA